MKIYLAGAYARRVELLGYRTQLEAIGHTVTSRWLLGLHEAQEGDWTRWVQFAREDLDDLHEADMLILFTEPAADRRWSHVLTAAEYDRMKRGGRHVEFGYAMKLGLYLSIVGPRENVFHHDPTVFQRDTWIQMLAYIGAVWTPFTIKEKQIGA